MRNEISILTEQDIQNRILTIRYKQVMIDHDLAVLYQVPTKRLNEQIKRNIARFPERFRFQLTKDEKAEVVANCDHLYNLKFSSTLPYVFTEQGVAMLSTVLNSDVAVNISIQIMDAFVQMRQLLANNASLFQRMSNIEQKQIATDIQLKDSDSKFEILFNALEDKSLPAKEGIFFDGQIFDAYVFVSKLIKTAKTSITLIDNYVDESVLILLSKRKSNCKAIIYTKSISKKLQLDLEKHNEQYPAIEIKQFKDSHDRFMIIDEKVVYHIGASLKDLGKKWFGFSKFDKSALDVLDRLK